MKSGPFEDRRDTFVVAVTGHAAAIPAGPWMWSPVGRSELHRSGAHEVVSYLDAVLYRRRASHRVLVLCRGDESGVDHLVRAYCDARKLACLPQPLQRDLWRDEAFYRRDLEMVTRSHAVVWFGPREPRDPVTLAAWLGIPYRVVALTNPQPEHPDTEGFRDALCLQACQCEADSEERGGEDG